MTTHKSTGGCHCGNITFEMELNQDPRSYNPRACDCEFCRKHGAAYLSDKNGSLIVFIENEDNLSKYQQGSGIADFVICKKCGVLVGIYYRDNDKLYAAINSKAVDINTIFGEEKEVSPKKITDLEKIQRWRDIWFCNVKIKSAE